MPTRYQPLADFLAAQPAETASVSVTLAEVAALLGGPLPAAAGTQSWWANARSAPHAAAWLAAGWRVRRVRVRRPPGTVTFVRATAATTARPAAAARP